VTDFSGYKLLSKYLREFGLGQVRSRIWWKWNWDWIVGDLSEIEEGMVDAIRGKRTKDYRRENLNGIWLIVSCGGGFLSQTALIDGSCLRSMQELESSARDSGFDRIVVADLDTETVAVWPNWEVRKCINREASP
jgi:hypothetical protein